MWVMHVLRRQFTYLSGLNVKPDIYCMYVGILVPSDKSCPRFSCWHQKFHVQDFEAPDSRAEEVTEENSKIYIGKKD